MSGNGQVEGSWAVHHSGPPQQRWNVVLLAEGFQEFELGTFEQAAMSITSRLIRTPPFDLLRAATNVYAVNIASDESGARDPVACGGTGAAPRTFFDAAHCNIGERRRVTVDDHLALRVARDAVPEVHSVVVVVNSQILGGNGWPGVAVFTLFEDFDRNTIHELAHTFGLADEYESDIGDLPPPGLFAAFIDLGFANISFHADRWFLDAFKWGRFIAPGTTLPTQRYGDPPGPEPPGTVGAYEGAFYLHRGAYRPEIRCAMKYHRDPFCRVCREHILNRLGPFLPAVSTSYLTIVARHSGKVLDVWGASTADGAPTIQYPHHGGQNQQWRMQDLGGGYVRFVARHSSKVLDVSGASSLDGAAVHQWTNVDAPNQQWRLEAVGGNYVRLVARHSGKVLDVAGASRAGGAGVRQSQRSSSSLSQQWRLVPVENARR